MIIKRRRTWEISEAAVTPEAIYRQRRQFVANAAAGCMVALGGGLLAACGDAALPASAGADEPESGPEDPSAGLYPFPRNEAYAVARAVTEEKLATTFNNFYEFGSS